MRAGAAKDAHHAGQEAVHAGSHVARHHTQVPHIHAHHASTSRSQAAQLDRALKGNSTLARKPVAPAPISLRTLASCDGVGATTLGRGSGCTNCAPRPCPTPWLQRCSQRSRARHSGSFSPRNSHQSLVHAAGAPDIDPLKTAPNALTVPFTLVLVVEINEGGKFAGVQQGLWPPDVYRASILVSF